MSRDIRLQRTPLDVLEYEILQEQAAALGRMGRALEAALATLREFDAAHPRAGAPASAQQARRTLVMEAGHALWMFVVQREACGLRDGRTVMRDYNVPGEVQQRMGARFGRRLGENEKRVHDRAEPSTEVEQPRRESKHLPFPYSDCPGPDTPLPAD
jgi:hypothetical protein